MMEKLKNIAANSQTSELAPKPKEIGCCTKDVTTKPSQNQKPLKPMPPAQIDPVTEAVPKLCATITRSQSQKPVVPSKLPHPPKIYCWTSATLRSAVR
ncbi:hypothetical protein GCK32_002239 [Trichostrongylus colubriformis]|uniref:Uncharacterized protein n=1 Tax=Trichostrongylus colubriformis TaxID=6319 RepID=A0AAN8IV39_TRICO